MLVNDLTSLSKMQAGVDALNLAPADLKQVAAEAIESYSLHVEQDGFRFTLETRGDTTAMVDEKKIYQVFSNLIGNAVRYSSDEKEVTVRLTEKEDCIRCEVIDKGQGISAEDLDSIWDRYYQSSSNHSRTSKGSGLGLSIVKQIFLLHHAEYGVESELNKGSDFWFELKKRLPDSAEADQKKNGKRGSRQKNASRSGSGKSADPVSSDVFMKIPGVSAKSEKAEEPEETDKRVENENFDRRI